ncbi:MAG TPA: hypothetical protein VHD90_16160 [Phototrophicaceae bacterium]|nr:hypothetical protein [Phototrophicaceae bacterium]
MADSLFDNRYRYDYIYPRGRSGETLRAVDTQDNDRPIVIKRPAPQDAPPIRAGQEVSILNERKALTRLAGHPVLTALIGGGQFSVSGTAHQYIVMERAEGLIVADLVSELAQRGERMPELEMLVVIDNLLDLLHKAHALDIVYNDVDAKHLFWDRDRYKLKLIDWGNAVFLEGDEITAQGISRQSDIFQVGELLYFILTGGGRADVPRDAGEDFRLNFGHDAERIHTRLQAIVSRAAHPNPRMRYNSILELRKDLTEYRNPLERERNAVIGRVVDRLRRELSKDELNGLLKALEPALAMDPGYPPSKQALGEIQNRINDLDVSADLDAARIYMESGNWTRAVTVFDELRARARGDDAALIGLMLDWAKILEESPMQPVPPTAYDAIILMFEGHTDQAVHLLLGVNESDEARGLQYLLAERITAHNSDILLLRPPLYRLEVALKQLESEGIAVSEPRAFLTDIYTSLDELARLNSGSLITLRDGYRAVVDQMTALHTFLGTVRAQHQLANPKLPLTALERATNAAMALADNMHVIGKQATSSPRDAMDALDHSRAIDPLNRAWDAVQRVLTNLYDLLGAYQTYVPAADGSDLEGWLKAAQSDLSPFVERLFDEMLVGMVLGLKLASEAWQTYAEMALQGNRVGAVTALTQATDAVSTISPTLAGWLNQLRTVVNNAAYVERHALYGVLGRALADGWENFDRGRLAEAERLGVQAFEIGRSDTDRAAARRLRDLSEQARDWVERNGISDAKRTQNTLMKIELLYTPDEIGARDNFAAQMPSKDTFLKAMNKGLVDQFARQNTGSIRILFFNYILLGALDAHEDHIDDAIFWRDAAVKAMGDLGAKHPTTKTLEEYTQRRRDLKAAADLLTSISGSHALATLESSRKALEENPQNRALAPAVFSLRELEAATRDWSDGEFRAAGTKLENAIRAVDEIETNAAITVTPYRSWLLELAQGAADLHANARKMTQIVESKPTEPPSGVRQMHRTQVEVTTRLLGASYAGNLKQWLDTYEQFLAIYTDQSLRRSAKLNKFNDLFRAMFIDRHPAYPLYRHWYNLVEQSPEFPPPPTNEPTPRITEAEEEEEKVDRISSANIGEEELRPFVRVDAGEPPDIDGEDGEPAGERPPRRLSPVIALIPIIILIIVAVVVFAISKGGIGVGGTDLSPTPSPIPFISAASTTPEAVAAVMTDEVTDEVLPTIPPALTELSTQVPVFATIAPLGTQTATATWTPSLTWTPTETQPPTSTGTLTATMTFTPSDTPTITLTPSPTLPPGGLHGQQDLLRILDGLTSPAWTSDQFSHGEDGDYWRLGIGSAVQGGTVINIAIPQDTLDALYGNDAADRIESMSADLELATFNPPLLIDNQVYFGMMLQPINQPDRPVGAQIQVAQPGLFNIGQRVGSTVTISMQRSVGTPVAHIRLERDLLNNELAIYVNNEQVGASIPFAGTNNPVLPVLYVREGGVIVHVTNWQITLK